MHKTTRVISEKNSGPIWEPSYWIIDFTVFKFEGLGVTSIIQSVKMIYQNEMKNVESKNHH